VAASIGPGSAEEFSPRSARGDQLARLSRGAASPRGRCAFSAGRRSFGLGRRLRDGSVTLSESGPNERKPERVTPSICMTNNSIGR